MTVFKPGELVRVDYYYAQDELAMIVRQYDPRVDATFVRKLLYVEDLSVTYLKSLFFVLKSSGGADYISAKFLKRA